MKSKNKQITILNDQDLIAWYENAPPFSLKKRMMDGFLKTTDKIMEHIFRGTGLYSRGYRNSLDLQVRHLELDFPERPGEFHGTNILVRPTFGQGYGVAGSYS